MLLFREELAQKTWVRQDHTILQEMSVFSTSHWSSVNWAPGIFCLVRAFNYDWSLESQCTSLSRLVYTSNVIYGKYTFSPQGSGARVTEASHSITACLNKWLRQKIKSLNTQAQVHFPPWQHITYVAICHCRVKHALEDNTRRDNLGGFTWLPLDFAHVFLTFVDFISFFVFWL